MTACTSDTNRVCSACRGGCANSTYQTEGCHTKAVERCTGVDVLLFSASGADKAFANNWEGWYSADKKYNSAKGE